MLQPRVTSTADPETIALAWPPALGRIFGGPAHHQIHHSAEEHHWDKNYGAIFALWDWLFGTAYWPASGRDEELGFDDLERFPSGLAGQLTHGFRARRQPGGSRRPGDSDPSA